MDIKIHIFSESNCYGKSVYFVYKNDGYACASLQWSCYTPEAYRLFNYVNKVCDKMVCKSTFVPWDKIEEVIKETIKRQSNIDVNKITFVGKHTIDKLFP